MTRQNIITLPNPKLRKASASVGAKDFNKVTNLVKSMQRAALDWEDHRKHESGVALAAVQVGHLEKVIVVRSDWRNKTKREFDIYINPVITRYDGEPVAEPEGCLSVKDVYGSVERYPKVKVKAQNLQGEPVKLIAKGFLARVFQHEIDHTKGITIVDRCGKQGTFFKLGSEGEMTELTDEERDIFLKKVGIKPIKSPDAKTRKSY